MKEYLRGEENDLFFKRNCKIAVVAGIGTWQVVSSIGNKRKSQELCLNVGSSGSCVTFSKLDYLL